MFTGLACVENSARNPARNRESHMCSRTRAGTGSLSKSPLPRSARFVHCALEYCSGEFFLRWFPNGGTAIFVRSLLSTAVIFLAAIWLEDCVDPSRTWRPSITEILLSIMQDVEWIGVIFAAVYAALYSRFASQWSYLANLYNLIKQVESSEEWNPGKYAWCALCEWKAGFIEDAVILHLASKTPFDNIVRFWSAMPSVRKAFIGHTDNGALEWKMVTHRLSVPCGDKSCANDACSNGATTTRVRACRCTCWESARPGYTL